MTYSAGKAKPKVLYLVGEVPFFERPDCEFIVIAQEHLLSASFEVDAFLPAASFAEAEGTLDQHRGPRAEALVQIENPCPTEPSTGFARPDWLIFSKLAQTKLGATGSSSTRPREAVLKEISEKVTGFPARPDRQAPSAECPRPTSQSKRARPPPAAPGRLPAGGRARPASCHRGMDLSSKVEGPAANWPLKRDSGLHP